MLMHWFHLLYILLFQISLSEQKSCHHVQRSFRGERVGTPFLLLECLRTPKVHNRLHDFAYTFSKVFPGVIRPGHRKRPHMHVLGPDTNFRLARYSVPSVPVLRNDHALTISMTRCHRRSCSHFRRRTAPCKLSR